MLVYSVAVLVGGFLGCLCYILYLLLWTLWSLCLVLFCNLCLSGLSDIYFFFFWELFLVFDWGWCLVFSAIFIFPLVFPSYAVSWVMLVVFNISILLIYFRLVWDARAYLLIFVGFGWVDVSHDKSKWDRREGKKRWPRAHLLSRY